MTDRDGLCHATILLGDGADMAAIGPGEAKLVLTSPPYFGPEVARLLAGPRSRQRGVAMVWKQVEEFARGLDGVFREIARVVGATGVCCIETKDLAFGDFRLPLAALHAEMARDAGLWVRSSVAVRTRGIKPSHLPEFFSAPMVGNFRTLDCATLLICSDPDRPQARGATLERTKAERLELISPFWRVNAARGHRLHEHQSPPEMIRRVIELFTESGDLVVDPFAGSGQTIRIARELGRTAVGYEIDPLRQSAALGDLVRLQASRGTHAGRARGGVR